MRILVTGASGYIGSALVGQLVTDTQNTIYAVTRSVNSGMVNQGIKVVECDFMQPGFTSSFPDEVDVVIHLAQSKNYRNFPDEADDIFGINVKATHELLEWSRSHKIQKFLLASTANVYKRETISIKEDCECWPLDYYGSTKLAAELLTKHYESFFKIHIMRIFGVYGPGQQSMVVSSVIDKVKNGQPVVLAQNVGLEFSPLYIKDCVNMIQTIVDKDGKEMIYNFCGDEHVTLADLARISGALLKVDPIIDVNTQNPTRILGDNSRFTNEFGYEIKTSFEEGIQKTIQA